MNDEKKYLIIPGCTDLNRGDQALTWETKRLAQDSGFSGQYYMMTSDDDSSQSIKEGINICSPILLHPSRFFRNNNNIRYTSSLKLLWGLVALFDLIKTLFILSRITRPLMMNFVDGRTKDSLRILKESKAVFVKGGGFIHAYGGITATYYIYFMLYHIMLALALKKPVYIMPNSFGPFKGPLVKFLVRKVLNKCNIVSARESISSNEIKKVLNKDVDVYPDLGFFIKPSKNESIQNFLNERNISKENEEKYVAITMRPYRFPGSKNPVEDYTKYNNAFKSLIQWLNDNNYHAILVEHTLSDNEHENDGSAIRGILSEIEGCKYTFISNNEFTCRDLKYIYSQCDYVVGTRFHSVIFAMGSGVPSIAITYGGNKGDGIMQDMGLSEYAIPIEHLDSSKLISCFKEIIENRTKVTNRIQNYLNFAEEQREKFISIIAKDTGR